MTARPYPRRGDVVLAEDMVPIPDVVVGRRTDYTEPALVGVPVLAVEVISPRSRLIDTKLKRATLSRGRAAGSTGSSILTYRRWCASP